MLGYFLRKTNDDLLHLFAGLEVTRDAEAMAHFQKYPVVFVTFKDVKATTFASAITGIREQLASACRDHVYLFEGGNVHFNMLGVLQRSESRDENGQ